MGEESDEMIEVTGQTEHERYSWAEAHHRLVVQMEEAAECRRRATREEAKFYESFL